MHISSLFGHLGLLNAHLLPLCLDSVISFQWVLVGSSKELTPWFQWVLFLWSSVGFSFPALFSKVKPSILVMLVI